MKILLVILALFVGLIFTMPVYSGSAPHIYFNWEGTKVDNMQIILTGLESEPIYCDFVTAINPDNPDDQEYYKVLHEGLLDLPDGSYSITGRMIIPVITEIDGVPNITTVESEDSAPFPFVRQRIVVNTVEDVGLGVW